MSDSIFLQTVHMHAGQSMLEALCSLLWDVHCPCVFTGQWQGSVKGHPWGGSGSVSNRQGAHRGAGVKADSPQSTNVRHGPGSTAHQRQHTDGHHVWTHHGPGQAPTPHPSSARHLSISAFWQVSSALSLSPLFLLKPCLLAIHHLWQALERTRHPRSWQFQGQLPSSVQKYLPTGCVCSPWVLKLSLLLLPSLATQLAVLWNQTFQGTVNSSAPLRSPSSPYPSRLRVLVREITFLTKAAKKPR